MTSPRIKQVNPLNDYKLEILFDNNEKKIFDVSPYLEKGIFKQLQSPEYFKKVKASLGSITWPNGQDFCPDSIYIESITSKV